MKYNSCMQLRWPEDKAMMLKKERNIDVLHLAELFANGDQLDSFPNPKKLHQTVFVFNIDRYALVAICVTDSENEDGLFLKTAYYSRSFTAHYGLR